MAELSDSAAYKNVLDTIVALTSVLIVAFAIYGDRLKHWLAGPQLKVSLLSPVGEITTLKNQTTGANIGNARYYHFKVENGRSSAPAKSVKVVLKGIYRPGPNGRFRSESLVSALQFGYQWVNSPLHDPRPTVGSPVLCDLGYVVNGQDFRFVFYITPTNMNHMVKGGERVRIVVAAEAENAVSRSIVVEVAWDGEWHDGDAEMARHLVVTQLPTSDPTT